MSARIDALLRQYDQTVLANQEARAARDSNEHRVAKAFGAVRDTILKPVLEAVQTQMTLAGHRVAIRNDEPAQPGVEAAKGKGGAWPATVFTAQLVDPGKEWKASREGMLTFACAAGVERLRVIARVPGGSETDYGEIALDEVTEAFATETMERWLEELVAASSPSP